MANYEKNKYQLLFEKMPDAFAYHEIIYDQKGKPDDYIFLEINNAFEELTGLKRESVIGKKVTEIHPDIGHSAFDWIGVYGKVAVGGKSIRFEQFFEPANRWYDVSAFSDAPGYFAVSFREITMQKNENLALNELTKLGQRFLLNPVGQINYQLISDGLLELSGAKLTAINIYNKPDNKIVTKAVSGVTDSIRKASELLGFELTGKSWDLIPERINAIRDSRLLRFTNLYDSAFGEISRKTALMLEKIFSIGEVFVVEIGHEDVMIGDMIMFMPDKVTLLNPEIIKLYATQAGVVLMRNLAEDELLTMKSFYENIVQNVNEGVVISGNDGIVSYANPTLLNMIGFNAEEIVSKHWEVFVSPANRHQVEEADKRRMEGKADRYEIFLNHKSGLNIPVYVSGSPIFDNEKGNVIGSLAVMANISERKKVEEALAENELRTRALIEAIPDLIFLINREGYYLDASVKNEELLYPAAKKLYRENKLVGKKITNILPPAIAKSVAAGIEKALVTGKLQTVEYSYELYNVNYHFESRLAPIDNNRVVAIIRDVTERKKYEEKIRYISYHDELTGLYNRRYFENEMRRLEGSRDYPIAIISADLDGLKLINDTLGHAEGDRYLKSGAELLKSVLRSSDILARVGGDEFALILPRITSELGQRLIRRMYQRIDEYNMKDENRPPLSISFGLAVSKDGSYPLREAFRDADNAMYQEKTNRSKDARKTIVDSFIGLLNERSDTGEGNREQVQDLSLLLGRALRLEKKKLADIVVFSKIYDLGKINLPEHLVNISLLFDVNKLNEADREIIIQHPVVGFRIASYSPELAGVAELVLHHHENYDGSGYPQGLKGEKIPLECRILSIASAYSAMIYPGPYTDAKKRKVLSKLQRYAGTYFDPQIVEVFTAVISEENN